MADLQGETNAIVQAEFVDDGRPRYLLDLSEFDSAGKKSTLTIPIPRDERWDTILLRAALLKKGGSWSAYSIPQIMFAIVYAEHLGLDIEAGDVYMATEGRLSTTAGAKVKHAMSTGRIEGMSYEVTKGQDVTVTYKRGEKQETWTGPDLTVKVTLEVKGWDKPFVYEQRLKEWFVGTNPNWRTRPEYMLIQNTMGKACSMVAPMGVEEDEAPSLLGDK
jgi:RecT family protein